MISIFTGLLLSCSDSSVGSSDDKENRLKKAAYDSVSDYESRTIIGGWKDGIVEYGICSILNGKPAFKSLDYTLRFFILDEDFSFEEYQKLVSVTFNTINDSLLGPIIIILEPDEELVVGVVLRE